MRLNLPQNYISASQISQWRYSKQRYIDKYIFKIEPESPRPEMIYGKQFATWLEKGWDDAPPESKVILEKIKKYPKVEYEIKETFQCAVGEFSFLGFADGYDPKTHALLEYKTGRTPWDQNRVDQHLQIRLYAGILFKRYHVVPKVEIIWIPTHQVNGESVPTGEIFTFKANITVNSMLRALKEMETCALEIHEWYTDYQKSAELVLA